MPLISAGPASSAAGSKTPPVKSTPTIMSGKITMKDFGSLYLSKTVVRIGTITTCRFSRIAATPEPIRKIEKFQQVKSRPRKRPAMTEYIMPCFGRVIFLRISTMPKGRRMRNPMDTRRNAWVAGSMLEPLTHRGVPARNIVPRRRIATALPCEKGLTGLLAREGCGGVFTPAVDVLFAIARTILKIDHFFNCKNKRYVRTVRLCPIDHQKSIKEPVSAIGISYPRTGDSTFGTPSVGVLNVKK